MATLGAGMNCIDHGELERRVLGLIHGIERNTRLKYILRIVVETDIGAVKVPK
jgi:hypothetical protein